MIPSQIPSILFTSSKLEVFVLLPYGSLKHLYIQVQMQTLNIEIEFQFFPLDLNLDGRKVGMKI